MSSARNYSIKKYEKNGKAFLYIATEDRENYYFTDITKLTKISSGKRPTLYDVTGNIVNIDLREIYKNGQSYYRKISRTKYEKLYRSSNIITDNLLVFKNKLPMQFVSPDLLDKVVLVSLTTKRTDIELHLEGEKIPLERKVSFQKRHKNLKRKPEVEIKTNIEPKKRKIIKKIKESKNVKLENQDQSIEEYVTLNFNQSSYGFFQTPAPSPSPTLSVFDFEEPRGIELHSLSDDEEPENGYWDSFDKAMGFDRNSF